MDRIAGLSLAISIGTRLGVVLNKGQRYTAGQDSCLYFQIKSGGLAHSDLPGVTPAPSAEWMSSTISSQRQKEKNSDLQFFRIWFSASAQKRDMFSFGLTSACFGRSGWNIWGVNPNRASLLHFTCVRRKFLIVHATNSGSGQQPH